MKNIIYHGSEVIVEKLQFGFSTSVNKDYGNGFYCTEDAELGKERSVRNNTNGYLNKYEIDTKDLKILDLTDLSKYNVLNWLAILMRFRNIETAFKESHVEEFNFLNKYYVDPSEFDIVIGYRADDSYFRFLILFLDNRITLDSLKETFMAGDLGTQFVLISEKAFSKIRFISAIEVDVSFKEKFYVRITKANAILKKLDLNDRRKSKGKIGDLMEDDATR